VQLILDVAGKSTMLGKIDRIRKFGIFDDFSGGNLQEFCDFNLIYGFNYSGKTTLSRAPIGEHRSRCRAGG